MTVAPKPPLSLSKTQALPYLIFNGRCEEAVEFYRKAVGAEVQMLMRYKDAPIQAGQPGCPPALGDKVIHVRLQIGETIVLASDDPTGQERSFQGFSLALIVPNEAEADRQFNALAEGGRIAMPLAKTFFSPRFGQVVDRFGVSWMVLVNQ